VWIGYAPVLQAGTIGGHYYSFPTFGALNTAHTLRVRALGWKRW
jgi:hypothetical protein